MKRFTLALMILLGAITFKSSRADANGATVVFLEIRAENVFFDSDIRDVELMNDALVNVLEASTSAYVARVDPYIYTFVNYNNAQGKDVLIGVSKHQAILFRYYESLNAIVGKDCYGRIYVLMPKTVEQQGHSFHDTDSEFQ